LVQSDYVPKIINGYINGMRTKEIAESLDIGQSTVLRWIKKYNNKEVTIDEIPDHPHHYLIETPNGKTSRGVCKHCLIQKDFNNVGHANIAWLRNKDLT